MVTDTQLIGLLARACERLVGSIFAALDDEGFDGLSTTQALAVRMLASGPMTPRALAENLGVTPQAASGIAADLERRGLAARGRDPHDARVRPLDLTEAGRHVAATMHRAESASIGQWAAAAGPGDLDATARALQAYLDVTQPPRTPQPRRMRFN